MTTVFGLLAIAGGVVILLRLFGPGTNGSGLPPFMAEIARSNAKAGIRADGFSVTTSPDGSVSMSASYPIHKQTVPGNGSSPMDLAAEAIRANARNGMSVGGVTVGDLHMEYPMHKQTAPSGTPEERFWAEANSTSGLGRHDQR